MTIRSMETNMGKLAAAVSLIILATAMPSSGARPLFFGVGDLPGGTETNSDPGDISADGSTVVGSSYGPPGQEAFRWT